MEVTGRDLCKEHIHIMRNERYYSTLTLYHTFYILYYTFPKKNTPKRDEKYALTPMYPDVGSTWHAFKMWHLSLLLRMHLTSYTSCLIEAINAWMRDVYLPFAQSNSVWFFFVEDHFISQTKCCSLSSDDSFFVTGTTLRVHPIKQVKTCLFNQIFIFIRTHLSSSF